MSGRRRSGRAPSLPLRLGPDPLAGTGLLLVDGNNLLHRVAGGHGPAALHQLLSQLRAALPDGVQGIVVLDGPPDPGAPFARRIRPGLEVRHAGRRDADSLIVELLRERPGRERGTVLVVTDDRALIERVRSGGGVPRRVDWFLAFLGRGVAPEPRPATVAGPRPRHASPAGRTGSDTRPPGKGTADLAPPADPTAEAHEVEPWRPGRGATRKRGNPRRSPRHRP